MKPTPGSAWFNTAKELFDQGRLKESRKLLLDIHKISPRFSPALDLLSIIDFRLKNYDQAKSWIEILLKQSPKHPDLINRLVMILMQEREIIQAMEIINEGRKLDPDHPGLIYSDIKLSLQRGDQQKAKNLLDCIPVDHPLHIKCEQYLKKFFFERQKLHQSFSAASKKKDWNAALQILKQWSKHNEHTADTHYDMGLLYMKTHNYPKAIDHFQKSLAFEPYFHIAAFLYMWYIKLMICDWSDYSEAANTIKRGIKKYLESPDPNFDIPIYILSFFELEENFFKACGSKMYNNIIKKIGTPTPPIREPGERTRIGYLSSTFWAHAVGRVYQDIFSFHNREKFEIFIYSTNHKADPVSSKIIEGADTFRDLTNFETSKAFDAIVNDEIDILIIVGGHGDDMNTELIAMKPAPIAINAHGYNESLGGAFADYLISDKEIITRDNRPYFSENILFFPYCSIINSSPGQPVIKSRRDYGLPEDKLIFLSAAHPRKITPSVFRLWQRILENHPNSVLWIFDYGIDELRRNLKGFVHDERLQERIYFSGLLPYPEHLGRYHLADLLLDTPIYNCHSVGIEALRNGLPFITLRGKNANSRFGSSMLKTAGLDELICQTEGEYLQTALALTKNLGKLSRAKEILKRNNNPLFDTKKSVKELENLLLKIWNNHCDNQVKTDIHG